jgi:hypothetical protein
MMANRSRLTLAILVVAAVATILLWSSYRQQQAEIQQTIDRADRDVAAAKAAAADAADSASRAKDSAQDARNKLPGMF